MMIKLIKPYISFNDVKDEMKGIFDSGWFSKGPYVKQFCNDLVEYTGAQYANLTTSATTALSIALKLFDIKPGDNVLVSDFSFPATANVVEELYAQPIFVDVLPDTFNMDPLDLERKINNKIKAVIFVDALGNPSGLHRIADICRSNNIPLIEDGACALGSSEFNEKCGNIADITCFSFHPRKLLTTGEGGAITHNRAEWQKILDIKLNHGSVFENNNFDFVDYGYNYRMSEIQALMGVKQLQKLDFIIEERNSIREKYKEGLEPIGFSVQSLSEGVKHNVQSMVFKVPPGVDRRKLSKYLLEREVESTLGTYSLSSSTYYMKKYNRPCSIGAMLQENTITLPCYDGVDVEKVIKTIVMFLNNIHN